MSDLTNVTIDSTSVSFDTVSDVDDEFRELVYGIFENLQGESKRLGQLRDEQQTNRELTKTLDMTERELVKLAEKYYIEQIYMDSLLDCMQDTIERNTDYSLINEIVELEDKVKGLENDIWVYQNHECPEAICPECDEFQVKVEDDTWQDTKPEMGTAVKDAVEAFKDDTVLLPITNNRIFS